MIGETMVVATVPVTDLEQAKDFYGETLGLTFLWETPASVRWRCGASSELSTFKRPPIVTEHTLAHFEVTDIEVAVSELGTRGVAFNRLHGRAAHDDGPHRPTRSCPRRLVP
jgi:catechol 2,3-dioxygenase-like lactoylglutathione lyase family enzyme